ncbi:hypothetical protein NCAS_0C05320 [Naumovozyma castellii]|uniref:Tryptophan--tRNA ligase, mitochondrial n=1 Tax=Naumovozyma castellii TaxID=27288 RepID=G0VDG0_NAUCA|nr:hypothetical protein NCAS_0C05320 [Naumovozyma castellii CBS 4309]CCC69522.1 hypothetical protein NCAS_0C05320 [Naumovozyma castellii CBS 4309]
MLARRCIPRSTSATRLSRGLASMNSKGTVQNTDYALQDISQTLPSDATIFSLIQPTGKFHLGNYLGATRIWKQISQSKQPTQTAIFGVADLHAITVPKPDPMEFLQCRREALASILSLGIDPQNAIMMYQSEVPQHTQLHWVLSTFTSMGVLNRMTQWKAKAKSNHMSVKLGLFSYPVLQAADILLYKATHVPVGDDQCQPLELCRSIAQQFNQFYGDENFFPIPRTILAPTKKILSLGDPLKKMSKSDPNKDSNIYVNDAADVIVKKIRKAVTDSVTGPITFDPVNRPGVSNLLNMVSGITQREMSAVEQEVSHLSHLGEFKNYVAEIVVEELRGPRERYEQLMNEPEYLKQVGDQGAERARAIAEVNMRQVYRMMGF